VIGKSHSGAGFGGLTRYLLNGRADEPRPDRVLWTSTRELAFEDPRDAAVLMRATASQGRTAKPVQHLSISLAPGEHLTREQWEKVIDTTLSDLGLAGHQALIVAHQDTAHEHIHLVVNRVHPETYRAWDRWQDRHRLMESLRPQEKELSLRQTPHIKNPDGLPDRLVQQFERTGEPPLIDFARLTARPIFREVATWSQIHEQLREHGLYLDRKGQGLVVSDDRHHVKASSVDRAASLRALEARLGPYQPGPPLLQSVDRALSSELRRSEITEALAPLRSAQQDQSLAQVARDQAAQRLDHTAAALQRGMETAFRNPAEAFRRYLEHLQTVRSPEIQPAELGRLRGAVLYVGRHSISHGKVGDSALQVALHEIPRLGAQCLQAQAELSRHEGQLATAQSKRQLIEVQSKPLLDELHEIKAADHRLLPQQVIALRPQEQVALARSFGADVVIRAAQLAPDHAVQPVTSRLEWTRDFTGALDRALDRQLTRRGIPLPPAGSSPNQWLEGALDRGLRPTHAIQALARAGVPLADTLNALSRALALSRAVTSNPVKAASLVAAKALGVPALPMRLATIALSIAKTFGRTLAR
jgi:hypothetical protein